MDTMETSNAIALGFIGFGEAPYHIARGLSPERVRLYAFDIRAEDSTPKAEKVREHAAECRVTLVASLAELLRCGEVFLNFTSADVAPSIAAQAAPLLRPGQFYLDMNSMAPQSKREIASIFEASRGNFVEAAVMSSVPANGPQVPISLCGRAGAAASALLNALGMNTTFLSEEIGLASASKILRSVLAKGMIALLTETVFAADHYHLTEEVLEKLYNTMTREMTFQEFCHYSVCSAAIHNGRFCHEMEEALRTLEALHENSIMTQATLTKFEWLHQRGFSDYFSERPRTYDEVLEVKKMIENGAK